MSLMLLLLLLLTRMRLMMLLLLARMGLMMSWRGMLLLMHHARVTVHSFVALRARPTWATGRRRTIACWSVSAVATCRRRLRHRS